MAAIYSYCLYVVLVVFQRLNQGLSETLATRLDVVNRAKVYVIGYSLFWLIVFVFEFADFFVNTDNSTPSVSLNNVIYAIFVLFTVLILSPRVCTGATSAHSVPGGCGHHSCFSRHPLAGNHPHPELG